MIHSEDSDNLISMEYFRTVLIFFYVTMATQNYSNISRMDDLMKLLTVRSSSQQITNKTLYHALSNKMHLAISGIQGMSTKRIDFMEMESVGLPSVTYSLGNKLITITLTVRCITFKQIQHTQSLNSKMVLEE